MDGREMSQMMFDAWNNRDWDAIRNVLHPDYLYTGPDGENVSGVEDGLAAAWTSAAEAFPDGRVEVNSIYVDGNTVITEFHVKATHGGTFLGVAPTGHPVEIDFCNIMEIKDGRVLKERDYLDTLGLLAQLGVVGPPRAAPLRGERSWEKERWE
jgi:steroid delta-isomerase-like uncharacterized protein